ncbi:MAG TPA: hypothetical protein VJS64_09870 [Pyrinomonadaceae bacterium]|nr:hypothetical protein [Pyrinomonadaceae bacterium]
MLYNRRDANDLIAIVIIFGMFIPLMVWVYAISDLLLFSVRFLLYQQFQP